MLTLLAIEWHKFITNQKTIDANIKIRFEEKMAPNQTAERAN
jgi:hypothetical protein